MRGAHATGFSVGSVARIDPYCAERLRTRSVHDAFQLFAPSVSGRMNSTCWPGRRLASRGSSVACGLAWLSLLSANTQFMYVGFEPLPSVLAYRRLFGR